MCCFSAPATAPGRSSRSPSFATAGSHPKGAVNPLAPKTLAAYGYPTEGLRSKSWDEFATPDAPQMDFIFTVCDNAAGEACPLWPGQPMMAHWGIEDPAAVEGTDIVKARAFSEAFWLLRNRIRVFTALPIKSLDELARGARRRDIGHMADSPSSLPEAG